MVNRPPALITPGRSSLAAASLGRSIWLRGPHCACYHSVAASDQGSLEARAPVASLAAGSGCRV
jgi:hypothetical protein